MKKRIFAVALMLALLCSLVLAACSRKSELSGGILASEFFAQTERWVCVHTIYDGWIYYTSGYGYDPHLAMPGVPLHRIRTDGSGGERLTDFTPIDVKVKDGWIYYTRFDEWEWDNEWWEPTWTLNKMRVDGSEHTTLVSYENYSVMSVIDCIHEEWISFRIHENHYQIRIDGSEHEKYTHHGEWNPSELEMFEIMENATATLSELNIEFRYFLGVDGEWIFYQAPSTFEQIHCESCGKICECFLSLKKTTPGEIYKVRTDGSNAQAVKFFIEQEH